ncbi:Uncharacterised protein [Serratia fonticola]|uniref:Uncharacterized protein n=1 Tax=Serratia fonticola TaxID=47917 RepID=A0A4U9WS49_SERFO|nr:Uncharacterised protein [Serratia fonticola]
MMAAFAGLLPDAGLLHRLESEWLWVAPRAMSFAYGVLPAGEAVGVKQAFGSPAFSLPSHGG